MTMIRNESPKVSEKLTPIGERLAEQEKLLFTLHDYITRLENRLTIAMEMLPGADGKANPERPFSNQLVDEIEKRNGGIQQANSRLEQILSRLQI